mmetsp:Transcript_69197/g.218657  ORF Transcript_69197/g.218657 Transcript_69197/m.218657 type:complete len:226 (-) Transcript_69197:553-1230(-)
MPARGLLHLRPGAGRVLLGQPRSLGRGLTWRGNVVVRLRQLLSIAAAACGACGAAAGPRLRALLGGQGEQHRGEVLHNKAPLPQARPEQLEGLLRVLRVDALRRAGCDEVLLVEPPRSLRVNGLPSLDQGAVLAQELLTKSVKQPDGLGVYVSERDARPAKSQLLPKALDVALEAALLQNDHELTEREGALHVRVELGPPRRNSRAMLDSQVLLQGLQLRVTPVA